MLEAGTQIKITKRGLRIAKGEVGSLLEEGTNEYRIRCNDASWIVPKTHAEPVVEKKKRFSYHQDQAYIQKLIASRTPEEKFYMDSFGVFISRCKADPNFQLTWSASETVTQEERAEYIRRSGRDLPVKRRPEENQIVVDEETQGCKRNTIVSFSTVEGLQFLGVEWKPFFKSTEKVVAFGDRIGLWWSLVDAGFVITEKNS